MTSIALSARWQRPDDFESGEHERAAGQLQLDDSIVLANAHAFR